MKKLLLIALIFLLIQPSFAVEVDNLSKKIPSKQNQTVDLNDKFISFITFESLSYPSKNINQNSTTFLDGFQKATLRYTQTNVVAAYKDFSNIIVSLNGKSDFLNVIIARRLNSLGFFTLAQNAMINIEDTELWSFPVNSIKKLYNPAVTLTYDEEIYLAQLQASTLYNNSAKETIKILEDNDKLLKKSDYANYVLAVAYFENKNYQKSLNAINKAINKAPDCINYIHFKEKIYTQTQDYKNALKLINEIEKSDINETYLEEVFLNDKLYILMKLSKADKAKYYSAKLLFQTQDYQTALKEAQAAININKKNLDAYALIGDYYIKMNDLEKAKEYYTKAYNINKKFVPSLLGLGHCYYINKDYNNALEYYKKAYKYSSKNEQAILYLANTYLAIGNKDEAADYLKKALKLNHNSDDVYYLMSKLIPNMKEHYIRTTISINPTNMYAWLDLVELKIEQKNYKSAKEYLFYAGLIEPDNPRYLYLKKLVEQQRQNNLKSSYNTDFVQYENIKSNL